MKISPIIILTALLATVASAFDKWKGKSSTLILQHWLIFNQDGVNATTPVSMSSKVSRTSQPWRQAKQSTSALIVFQQPIAQACQGHTIGRAMDIAYGYIIIWFASQTALSGTSRSSFWVGSRTQPMKWRLKSPRTCLRLIIVMFGIWGWTPRLWMRQWYLFKAVMFWEASANWI